MRKNCCACAAPASASAPTTAATNRFMQEAPSKSRARSRAQSPRPSISRRQKSTAVHDLAVRPQPVLTASRSWPLHLATACRDIEQRAAATLPAHTLMARAGDAVARLALALAPQLERARVR